MNYRNLGRSGLRVSPLCLGAMMFGKWGNPDHEECIRIIRRALDLGINFIDTSNNYSEGESETIVGRALHGYHGEVVLATKVWAPVGPGANQRGLSRKAIREQVELSLKRLKVEAIDLYQIHRPDPDTPWEETLSALTDLVRQGKLRYLGCSTSHQDDPGNLWGKKLQAWQLVESLWVSQQHGFERWISLQPPYSLLRRTMEAEHFPVTERFGLGNIIWSPLEGGWLSGKYRRGRPNPEDSTRARQWVGETGNPKFQRRLEVVEALLPMVEAKGVTLAQFAIAWTLRHPAVTSAIIGPRTLEQLEDCERALDVVVTREESAKVDELVPPGTTVL